MGKCRAGVSSVSWIILSKSALTSSWLFISFIQVVFRELFQAIFKDISFWLSYCTIISFIWFPGTSSKKTWLSFKIFWQVHIKLNFYSNVKNFMLTTSYFNEGFCFYFYRWKIFLPLIKPDRIINNITDYDSKNS